MNKIHTKAHVIYRDEHDIIHVDIQEGAHVDKEAILDLHSKYKTLSKKDKMLLIINANAHHTITDEATEYIRRDMLDKDRLATAIVSKKLGIRIMVDYFNNIAKTKSQVKMFPTEAGAMKWLIAFKNELN